MKKLLFILILLLPFLSYSQESKFKEWLKPKTGNYIEKENNHFYSTFFKYDSLTTINREVVKFPISNKKILYQKILNLDSVKSEEIYLRSKIFITENYKSSNDVIQLDDKENGLIIVKGVYDLDGYYETNAIIRHTLKIYIKNGKCKIDISDFYCEIRSRSIKSNDNLETFYKSDVWKNKFILNVYKDVDIITTSLIDEFIKSMYKKISNDGW